MTDDGSFTVKNIKFEYCDFDSMIVVLRKIKDGVESIEIDFTDDLAGILEILQVQNVPYWHIEKYYPTDSLHKVAQMWIDKNSKIGTTFQVAVHKEGSFQEFFEHFTDRIV
ncbi:hypothetical protein B9Z55_012758 [Caenorhabditis nigoni]|uniref:Methyltransferase FkbM domain-containing protein n=1 Tax=Caenorhabditis nigoni TaxID=1611254 RepID=A0A2G5TYR8_9PELO|nr:hypothetical protein B9Z55_012758 [Caenorhabditis nigoni]